MQGIKWRRGEHARPASGFTVIEALLALAVATTALTAAASLFVVAAAANQRAARLTRSSWLAAQKIEQLRGVAALPVSPPDALERDAAGFVDYADAFGRAVPGVAGAMYVRRWSVLPDAGDPDAVVLNVVVLTRGGDGGRPIARLMAIRRREPS